MKTGLPFPYFFCKENAESLILMQDGVKVNFEEQSQKYILINGSLHLSNSLNDLDYYGKAKAMYQAIKKIIRTKG